jgi:glycerol-3-phosphate dehydrogenase
VNYVEVEKLIRENKKVKGAVVFDHLSRESFEVRAKVVINATGVFADDLIAMDNEESLPMVSPSQGVHLVVDRKFFPGGTALMIPKTDDDRVLFAVPWSGKLVLGTTDTPVDEVNDEPVALEEEIRFIISHFNRYSSSVIQRSDVLSVFAGLRPLVKSAATTTTALISRDHTILVSNTGLITIIGGKWTTYRKMAMDALRNAIFVGKLESRACVTENLKIHGWVEQVDVNDHLHFYGLDAKRIREFVKRDAELGKLLHPAYPFIKAEVVWAVRNEMAMTVEDVLARRIRLLFLDARAAVEVARVVAELMATEMGKSVGWVEEQVNAFESLASNYILSRD